VCLLLQYLLPSCSPGGGASPPWHWSNMSVLGSATTVPRAARAFQPPGPSRLRLPSQILFFAHLGQHETFTFRPCTSRKMNVSSQPGCQKSSYACTGHHVLSLLFGRNDIFTTMFTARMSMVNYSGVSLPPLGKLKF
jgi:hypothetical protein